MKLQSDFAILDVKRGRVKLRERLRAGVETIPITIVGRIDGTRGNDDGESQEFSVEVDYVDVA